MADSDIDETIQPDAPIDGETEPKAEKPIKTRRLTLKQQSFISNITNPDALTFGNGTQSVLAIPGRKGYSYSAASKQAGQYLDNPRIQSEISVIANQVGLSNLFRLTQLHLVAEGQYVTTEISERVIKGKRVKVRTTRTPKASEVIKAIDVANKMVGQYEANRAMANAVSTRFRELARLYKPKVETVNKSRQVKAKARARSTEPIAHYGYWPVLLDSEPTEDTTNLAYEA